MRDFSLDPKRDRSAAGVESQSLDKIEFVKDEGILLITPQERQTLLRDILQAAYISKPSGDFRSRDEAVAAASTAAMKDPVVKEAISLCRALQLPERFLLDLFDNVGNPGKLLLTKDGIVARGFQPSGVIGDGELNCKPEELERALIFEVICMKSHYGEV